MPADLARERRIRDDLAALGAMPDGNPRLAARTAAVLRGDLDAPDLEEGKMTQEWQAVVRVAGDIAARADALAERMADLPKFKAWRITRTAVLRLARLRGLEALEAEQGRARSGAVDVRRWSLQAGGSIGADNRRRAT